jgi:VWFA-related protein
MAPVESQQFPAAHCGVVKRANGRRGGGRLMGRPLFLAAFCVSCIAAQTPSPVDGTSAYTLRFDVNLVQVDAIVTDASGRHVPGLKKEEFEVLQDGVPQTITAFSWIPAEPAPAHPATPTTRQFTRDEIRRTVLIFVDDLQLSLGDFAQMRRDLLRFIDHDLRPGDFYAFYRTSGGTEAWELYTRNLLEIRSAVEHMTFPLYGFDIPGDLHAAQFFRTATAALQGLHKLPGRKTMIVVGGGFPIDVRAAQGLTDLANRASVTIHTVDVRGLPAGASVGTIMADASIREVPSTEPDLVRLNKSQLYYLSQQLASELAGQTGGLHLHDRNDLIEELRIATHDSEGYYLIGWTPPSGTFAEKRYPDYREIKLRVRQPGLKVRSRAGFFSVPGESGPEMFRSAEFQMREALMSPFRSDGIEVSLYASFDQDERSGQVIQSLVHIAPEGIDFRPAANGCFSANLELLSTARPLDSSKSGPGRTNSQMAALEICGNTAEVLRRRGLVYILRNRISQPGAYEMRVAVRNTLPDDQPSIGTKALLRRDHVEAAPLKAGSARQFVEVPEMRKTRFGLAGIALTAEGAIVPKAMRTASSGAEVETFYRPPAAAADPAIREFTSDQVLNYECRLVEGSGKAKTDLHAAMRILHEGGEAHAEVVPVMEGSIRGSWRLAGAERGQYTLEIDVQDLSAPKTPQAIQRIDFSIR